MDTTQMVILMTLIVGVTELIRRVMARDIETAATIIAAGVIGGLLGIAHYYNLDLITGIAAGFSASGAVKIVSKLGNGSSPTPTTLVR